MYIVTENRYGFTSAYSIGLRVFFSMGMVDKRRAGDQIATIRKRFFFVVLDG